MYIAFYLVKKRLSDKHFDMSGAVFDDFANSADPRTYFNKVIADQDAATAASGMIPKKIKSGKKK